MRSREPLANGLSHEKAPTLPSGRRPSHHQRQSSLADKINRIGTKRQQSRLFRLALLLVIVLCLLYLGRLELRESAVSKAIASAFAGRSAKGNRALGFSRIYMVHMRGRRDRKARMDLLAKLMGVDFQYIDALSIAAPEVELYMNHVREQRRQEGWCDGVETTCWPKLGRRESLYLKDALDYADNPLSAPLGLAGSELWLQTAAPAYSPDDRARIRDTPSMKWASRDQVSRAHAEESHVNGFTFDQRRPIMDQPGHPLGVLDALLPGHIASWYSHMQAVRQFADSGLEDALFLEDDVDFESDARQRLDRVRTVLPPDWDFLYLGYCWSGERKFEPINASVPELRPTEGAVCTHAYALSRRGAYKTVRYLRSPAFAYSRPYDVTYFHLVNTERLNSYSITPSIVAQVKNTLSDIVPGQGDGWQDYLEDGVLTDNMQDRPLVVELLQRAMAPSEK